LLLFFSSNNKWVTDYSFVYVVLCFLHIDSVVFFDVFLCWDTLFFSFFFFFHSYQLEALEQALKQNTIVFLETGSGKTLIATMLLRSYAHLLRKPSRFIAVFLVPEVFLVRQV